VPLFEVVEDFAQAEDAHGDRHEINSVGQFQVAEGEAAFAGEDVPADRCQQQADGGGDECLGLGTVADGGDQQDAEQCERRVFGRAEVEGKARHDGRQEGQAND